MAVVAAVPGLVDYLYVVPPQSTGRRRATRHMVLNLAATAVFGIAWLLRGSGASGPGAVSLTLEILALISLAAGGYLGGTLVTRNLISIDHRYAQAGKWRETTVPLRPGHAVVVAQRDELKVDQMKLLRVGDRRIALARTERSYVAFDDRCTHRGGSLAGGVMICGTVQCLWHGSQFDAASGTVKAGPARDAIRVYEVTEEGDEVKLKL
jgi:nitrite reductase/ring-hydroxylating ferredoxin subunit